MIVAQTKTEPGTGTEDRGLGGKKKPKRNTVPSQDQGAGKRRVPNFSTKV